MSSVGSFGGTFSPAGTSFTLNRMGFGTMQLTGAHVWGEPRDPEAAIAVLREAVKLGVNHIDTSDFYGPHVANRLIREALYPYPSDLTIVTKVGVRRAADKSWPVALSRQDLTEAVHDNLRNLGLDALDIVNLRVGGTSGTTDASIAEPLGVLVDLKREGLIKHIGLSNISRQQFAEGESISEIVCVQNHYNVSYRHDDIFIDELARKGVAFVPYFPLGGFQPLDEVALDEASVQVGATPRQVALAWLLARSPNVLVIAGTSSPSHLRENLAAASLELSPAVLAKLDAIAQVS
jgi:pyridoxine 4-dehydrogenase